MNVNYELMIIPDFFVIIHKRDKVQKICNLMD